MKEISTPLSSGHITISSSSNANSNCSNLLRCSYSKSKDCTITNDDNEILSISTTDTERCPVTWYGGKKTNARLRLDYVNNKETPSPNTKVLSWINNSCKLEKDVANACLGVPMLNSIPSSDSRVSSWINYNWKFEEKHGKLHCNKPVHVFETVPSSEIRIAPLNGTHNGKETSSIIPFTEVHLDALTSLESIPHIDNANRSSILVRQDYKKHDTIALKCSEDFRTVGSGRSKSSDRKLLKKGSHLNRFFRARSVEREMNIKTSAGNFGNANNSDIKKNIPNNNGAKLHIQKCGDEEIPLSPESQKKKELCTYLQLMNMNPSTNKETIFMQNRRSTRVKNYILMSEKRKLEVELKNKNNSCDSNEIKNICCKSFSQLGMKINEHEDVANKTNIFPALPHNVPDSCGDFDKDMLTFINTEKIDIKKSPTVKNNGHLNNNRTKKVARTKLIVTKKEKNDKNIPKKKVKPSSPNSRTISRYINEKNRQLRSDGKLKNIELKRLLLKHCNIENLTSRKLVKNRKIVKRPIKTNIENLTSRKLVKNRKILKRPTKMNLRKKLRAVYKNNNSKEEIKKGSSTINSSPKVGDPKVMLTRFNENSLKAAPPKPAEVAASNASTIVFCGFENNSAIESKVKTLNEICQSLFNRIVIGPSLYNKTSPDISSSENVQPSSSETAVVDPDSNTPDVDHNYSKSVDDEDDIDTDTDIVESVVIEDDDDEMSEERKPEVFNTDEITSTNCEIVPLNDNIEIKSLHRNLTQMKRKHFMNNLDMSNDYNSHSWDSEAMHANQKVQKTDNRRNNNSIFLSDSKGAIINAFYVDFNLIIVQELMISFWSQSALGNVLGAQNLWIPKGNIQRLILDNGCVHRKSKETIISLENSVAYVELWTKEHKSDKRERPVSDVFATIYFCRHCRHPDKKVLQLENIKGFAEDVQYVILTNSRNIVVSWRGFCDEAKVTVVHCYNLAVDYQTVASIKEMKSVKHYVSSLHNIEDCDNLVLGYGENKVTLWNADYGYVVATIDLLQTNPSPTLLWAKCDRGFLFALQRFSDGKIRLVAINGINHSWKCLQVYKPPEQFERLRGVCVDNEVLVAFYNSGILSWNVQSGELIYEEAFNEPAFIPSGKYVIINIKDQIVVKHVLSYLVMCDV